MTHNYKINVIVGANTGMVHAITPASLASPDSHSRYRTACHARIVGEHRVAEQDAVTCTPCRSKPLHLPHYREGVAQDDAGLFCCAECGTSEAETYVVTFLGGDQGDPTGRTEVCLPCHDALEDIEDRVRCLGCGLIAPDHGPGCPEEA